MKGEIYLWTLNSIFLKVQSFDCKTMTRFLKTNRATSKNLYFSSPSDGMGKTLQHIHVCICTTVSNYKLRSPAFAGNRCAWWQREVIFLLA